MYHDIVSRLVDSGAECVHSYGQCERFIGYLTLRSEFLKGVKLLLLPSYAA